MNKAPFVLLSLEKIIPIDNYLNYSQVQKITQKKLLELIWINCMFHIKGQCPKNVSFNITYPQEIRKIDK